MDNISKVLIIIGAILISIAVISVGIIVASRSQNTLKKVENATVDKAKITSQVSKFGKYQGELVGSEVKQCIIEAIAYNSALAKGNKNENLIYAVSVSVDGLDYVKKNNYTNSGGATSKVTNMSIDIDNIKKYNGVIDWNSNGTIDKIRF